MLASCFYFSGLNNSFKLFLGFAYGVMMKLITSSRILELLNIAISQ